MGDLFEAVQAATARLHGAYAIAVMHCVTSPTASYARGFPLILGVGNDGELPRQRRWPWRGDRPDRLSEEGDQTCNLAATGSGPGCRYGRPCRRPPSAPAHPASQRCGRAVPVPALAAEIFEQPRRHRRHASKAHGIVPELFDGAGLHGEPGAAAWRVFSEIDNVLILACGTSYYSGCTAKYWLEDIAGIPTQVEVASEYRYRTSVPNPRTLVVTISQSGETADTLAALRHAQSWACSTRSPSATWPPAPWCANASSPTSPAPGSRLAWPAPRPSPRSSRACSC